LTSKIGSPAILESFMASQKTSLRKREPVALRFQLSLDLPLSQHWLWAAGRACQSREIRIDGHQHLFANAPFEPVAAAFRAWLQSGPM